MPKVYEVYFMDDNYNYNDYTIYRSESLSSAKDFVKRVKNIIAKNGHFICNVREYDQSEEQTYENNMLGDKYEIKIKFFKSVPNIDRWMYFTDSHGRAAKRFIRKVM